MIDKIAFQVQDNSFNSNFIISYILFIIGLKSESSEKPTTPLSDTIIYYGLNRPNDFNGIFIQKNQKEILDLKKIEKAILKPTRDLAIDIVQLTESLICDNINSENNAPEFDAHDRLKFKSSHQYRNGYSGQPAVNLIILLLEKTISHFYSIDKTPLWPGNKKAAIILSHDVDAPIKYAHLFNYKSFPGKSTNVIKHYYHLLRITKDYIFDKSKDDYWLFDDIINFEKSLGFKSTFFFAAIDNKQKGASIHDVDYKISDSKFLEVFEKIKLNNFEIGLHASYNAFQHPNNFMLEKKKLEEAVNAKVIGLRHHYWHLGKNYRNTLKYHDKAGFEYDSSIAFNDYIGFRNNIALPYPILFEKENTNLNLIEIPAFCMDGNIFYNKISMEEGFREIASKILLIKENNGMGSIDWHVRTSFPKNKEYKLWGELYCKTLEWLAKDDELWVTNCHEATEWLKVRKKKLTVPNNTYTQWLQ